MNLKRVVIDFYIPDDESIPDAYEIDKWLEQLIVNGYKEDWNNRISKYSREVREYGTEQEVVTLTPYQKPQKGAKKNG